MKKIYVSICLLIGIFTSVQMVHAEGEIGAAYHSKSDATFYGKYTYPDKEPDEEIKQPSQDIPAKPINNENSLAMIPRLGDVDVSNINILGIFLISTAILLQKRKVIKNHE